MLISADVVKSDFYCTPGSHTHKITFINIVMACFQDEKNQIIHTNVWLNMVQLTIVSLFLAVTYLSSSHHIT